MNVNNRPISHFLIAAASFVIVAAGLREAQAIIIPLLLSILIALVCSPALGWLIRRKIPTAIAIVLILIMLLVVGSLLGGIVGKSIQAFIQDLPEYQQKLQELTQQATNRLEGFGLAIDQGQISNMLNPGSALKLAGNVLSSLKGAMTNIFLVLLLVTFLMTEGIGFSAKVRTALGDNNKAVPAFGDIISSIQRYMGLKTMTSLTTGIIITLWLLFLDLNYPLMWGMLAFLLNFIPNVGSFIAAIPAVLLALIQLGPLGAALTAVGYTVVNITIGSILEPRIMGRGLNLSPLVVFLSLIFWGFILGPIGMLLSVPLMVVIKIVLESIEQTRWIAVILGGGDADTTQESEAV